jgi:hypothetical protein
MSEWYLSNDIQAELSTEWFDKPEIVAELQLDPDMIRQDFTMKSNQGYLGQIKDNKGRKMTEQSIDVDMDLFGEEKTYHMPLIVPGLNKEEIASIKAGEKDTPAAESAYAKAVEHGKQRLLKGKDPFFQEGEDINEKYFFTDDRNIVLESDEVPIGNVGKDVDPSIIKSVLEKEKGFQNNPDDSGNYNKAGELIGTNLGITPATYEAVFGKEPTVEELKNITPIQAAKIYKKKFYERYNIDKLPSNLQKIAMHALVTGGPKTIKYLQELAGTKQDMLIGEQTTQAIKDKGITAKQLKDKVLSEYKKLDDWKKFGKGWTNRMNEIVSD